ncbi:flavodoxin domain-containing protein [Amycolatopsis tucumanensis]|uniref:Flavodoxin-like domain-containing protein n=1 Tax=Amycolatopsis tucumanensis TaxID=401106 RepID=A0ABP7HIJ9_9PSEU|nr:flavodoxin domain-containing protein [Amycolatopsis tucumanensis]MCF6421482.1 flavodoxin domain-containing protein [Amycolatopsis tucumanensis]
MNKLTVLFGTESGNAELVAEDIAAALEENGAATRVVNMEDYPVDELGGEDMLILVVSTYGEGDLPATAAPFHEALVESKPDLSGVRFAAFGLGDSTYDTYNLGVATLRSTLTGLGATQVGETGYHDADSGLNPSDVAIAWAGVVLAVAAPA